MRETLQILGNVEEVGRNHRASHLWLPQSLEGCLLRWARAPLQSLESGIEVKVPEFGGVEEDVQEPWADDRSTEVDNLYLRLQDVGVEVHGLGEAESDG